jgi:dihydrofolate reductase
VAWEARRAHGPSSRRSTVIREALARARDAAEDQDVRLGGGVATIRQYLEAGLVDEMHIAIAPVLLGTGESLLTGIDLLRLGYRVSEHVAAPKATHVVLTRRPADTSIPGAS